MLFLRAQNPKVGQKLSLPPRILTPRMLMPVHGILWIRHSSTPRLSIKVNLPRRPSLVHDEH
ncbi:hypothetical protein HOLleu_08141 [Holothuria leucospilota]|uniref:Uncharacterized protein n=1 Tax=Holothuria leucospilota TaxID=206669 RepID=A0A9Q1CHU3_HOLLE|nr:hypothetical protein HOLleu_08141 [Holothuria leucospilota]